MPKFRNKQVIFEARQLDDESWQSIAKWCGGALFKEGEEFVGLAVITDKLTKALAAKGDWVVRRTDGGFFVAKDANMREACELVTDDAGAESLLNDMRAQFEKMTDDERIEAIRFLMDGYCLNCGERSGRFCNCLRDD